MGLSLFSLFLSLEKGQKEENLVPEKMKKSGVKKKSAAMEEHNSINSGLYQEI